MKTKLIAAAICFSFVGSGAAFAVVSKAECDKPNDAHACQGTPFARAFYEAKRVQCSVQFEGVGNGTTKDQKARQEFAVKFIVDGLSKSLHELNKACIEYKKKH